MPFGLKEHYMDNEVISPPQGVSPMDRMGTFETLPVPLAAGKMVYLRGERIDHCLPSSLGAMIRRDRVEYGHARDFCRNGLIVIPVLTLPRKPDPGLCITGQVRWKEEELFLDGTFALSILGEFPNARYRAECHLWFDERGAETVLFTERGSNYTGLNHLRFSIGRAELS